VTPLGEHLIRRIRLEGALTVADFMAEALAHPTLGYYRTAAPLGAAGDFTTAPEVSQMFGELVGLWCLDLWERMGSPNPVRLAELGPGRGTLAADALRATRIRPEFHRALTLHLVEINAALRERQEEAIRPHRPQLGGCDWLDDFAEVPPGPLLLVANEFFDALPVHQFQRAREGWRERVVTATPAGDGLAFAWAPAGPAIALLAPELADASEGTLAEISPAAIGLAAAIARRVASEGGAALVIDYGHAGERIWSLQAVRRHQRVADPLADPGLVDLSARVDFARLARAAREAGAAVLGPRPQGRFLEALGIRTRAEMLAGRAESNGATALAAALRRLLDPAEMGTLFQAIALAHPAGPLPAGFATR
jgi:NADH dehydrogenase [ubiquinone] 1 alpha subcomplex assembly factor 7